MLGDVDWSRAAWDVIGEQAEEVAECAGRLGIWTTVGAPALGLTTPNRPLNVVSGQALSWTATTSGSCRAPNSATDDGRIIESDWGLSCAVARLHPTAMLRACLSTFGARQVTDHL